MFNRIVTVTREDGEVDYLYEAAVKHTPPPYKVKAVDLTVYCSTHQEPCAEKKEEESNHL